MPELGFFGPVCLLSLSCWQHTPNKGPVLCPALLAEGLQDGSSVLISWH